MNEAGLKDFLAASYVGLLAPAKTPPDAVDALEKALVKALATKVVQDRFLATARSGVGAAAEFEGLRRLHQKVNSRATAEAAKAAGLKPE